MNSIYTNTDRGHIFQDMTTGHNYLLVRTGVTFGLATYNLVNTATGKARVSDINRLFTKAEGAGVSAYELNNHFGLNLMPVQHIRDTKIDLPDLLAPAKIDKAVAVIREMLNSISGNGSTIKIVMG